MKQKTRFKNFGNNGYQYRLLVHEWPIDQYRYRPPKSHVSQSLLVTWPLQPIAFDEWQNSPR